MGPACPDLFVQWFDSQLGSWQAGLGMVVGVWAQPACWGPLLPRSLLVAPDLTVRPLSREGCRARTLRGQREQTSWAYDVPGSEAFAEEQEPWLLLVFASRALVPSLTERGLQRLLRVPCARLFHSGIRHSLYARTSSLVEGGNLRFFWDVLLPSVISQHMLS